MIRHRLISGMPQIGKTTALLRIRDHLKAPCQGFHTEAIHDGGRKTGLCVITHNQRRYVVSSRQVSPIRVGRYYVHTAILDQAVDEALTPDGQSLVVYVDEIGTLLCQSARFVYRLESLFETHVVIGTIARHGHPLVERIRRRPDVALVEIDAENRDRIVGEITQAIDLETPVG